MSSRPAETVPRVTVTTLQKMREQGERIAMLTCYDASFASLLDDAGVDTILIGDSLGMVVQGHDSTLPVTLDDIVYHTRCVAAGCRRAMVIADMPFGSYQESPNQAFRHAAALMAAGAHMVKLEGGTAMGPTIAFLAERGIPVCGHIGLTPQSVHQLGGYRVQGKGTDEAKQLHVDAHAVEDAGARLVVIETIPSELGREVTDALRIPTIGIGAGPGCSGQVLVLHDMLDVYPGRKARFVKNFMMGAGSVQAAVARYVDEVKRGAFPGPEHGF